MRTFSKERKNIPIAISILHEQEFQHIYIHRTGKRRSFTDRPIRHSSKKLIEEGDRQVASIQRFHREEDV